MEKFPALQKAYDACRTGGCMPAVLNAANEVAVETFLEGKLRFPEITQVVAETMDRVDYIKDTDFDAVMAADHLARAEAVMVAAEVARRHGATE
jgi:1-deoxy-D-xylulose-5-phosphate reductoisomerase